MLHTRPEHDHGRCWVSIRHWCLGSGPPTAGCHYRGVTEQQLREAPLAHREGLRTVRLLNYPVRRGLRQQQYSDELLRELSLLMIGRRYRPGEMHAPQKLIEIIDVMLSRYSAMISSASERRAAAYERGDVVMTLEYPAPPEMRAIVVAFADTMDQVDQFCAAGDLLTLASPPELVELRRWTVSEFLRQCDGEEPRPWAGPLY